MDSRTLDQLVDAYQGTLEQAAERFGNGIERRVAIAMVTENARAARQRLVTAVPGGDRLTARLDAFLQEAEKMDRVGQGLAAAKQSASDIAKNLGAQVAQAALTLSWPPSALAIGGAILTWAGIFQGIGKSIGGGIAALATGILVLITRNPSIVGPAARTGVSIARPLQSSMQSGLQWSTDRFGTAVRTADNLGRGAEKLLQERLTSPAQSFFGADGPLPGWQISSQLRGTAKTILYGAVSIIVICILIVLYGIYDGFQEGVNQYSQSTCVTTFVTSYLSPSCPR